MTRQKLSPWPLRMPVVVTGQDIVCDRLRPNGSRSRNRFGWDSPLVGGMRVIAKPVELLRNNFHFREGNHGAVSRNSSTGRQRGHWPAENQKDDLDESTSRSDERTCHCLFKPKAERKMSIRKRLLSLFMLGLASCSSVQASDVGVDIAAITYDFESRPDDPSIILDMGNKVGFVGTTDRSYEYWGYENFDFGEGATHLTVTASSATQGGTLHVRLANHYNTSLTIATVEIPNTGGWDSFQDFTVEINQDVLAMLGNGRSLFFVVEDDTPGYLFDVEAFRFDNVVPPSDVTVNAVNYFAESYPSDDDIIRDMETKVGYITNGSWLRFDHLDVGLEAASISVRAASNSGGGTMYVTSQAPYGFGAANLIASVDIENTGGWDQFADFAVNLDAPIDGIIHPVYLNFVGDDAYLFDLESFTFSPNTINDIGVDINAATYDFESAPETDAVIADLGDKVGYIAADRSWEYFGFEGFNFGEGASTLTVRASSGSTGGTLYVRLANHYNPGLTVATIEIPNTGGWNSFQDFTVEVNQGVIEQFQGRNLFFVVTDEVSNDYQFDIQSFRFDR